MRDLAIKLRCLFLLEVDSLAGISPASSDFRPPHFRSPEMRSNSAPGHHNNIGATASFHRQDSILSNASTDFSNPSSRLFRGMNLNIFNPSNNGADAANNNQQRAGAAVCADPQDMALAQSSHSMGLPELSSMDDQIFWENMDSNLFDVFALFLGDYDGCCWAYGFESELGYVGICEFWWWREWKWQRQWE